jgi:hypothetical protein
MDNKTRDGLITSGVVIGLLGLLYFIFRKPNTIIQINPYGGGGGGNSSDPYSLVDKYEKIKFIKNYVANQSGYDASNQINKDMAALYAAKGLEWQPYWFPDSYAANTDNGINAWYAAIQKNEPTFTFYVDAFRKNYKVNTNDGSWAGQS